MEISEVWWIFWWFHMQNENIKSRYMKCPEVNFKSPPPQSVKTSSLRVLWLVAVPPAPSETSTQTETCTGTRAPTTAQMGLCGSTLLNTLTKQVGWRSIVTWSRKVQMCPTSVTWGAPNLVDTLQALWLRIKNARMSAPDDRKVQTRGTEMDQSDLCGHFCLFQSYLLSHWNNRWSKST